LRVRRTLAMVRRWRTAMSSAIRDDLAAPKSWIRDAYRTT
jgi:hypothetical protein